MKTEDIFKLVRHGRDWRMVRRNPARTTDVRLSAETGAHNPNMMGRAWTGYTTAQLDAMDDAAVVAAIKDTAAGLRRYWDARRARDGDYAQTMSSGTTMRPTNAGSLGTGWDERPEQVFDVGTGATPEDINRANDEFYNSDRAAARDRAGHNLSTSATPETIMHAHAKHWADFLGRPLGQRTLPTVARDGRRASHTTPDDINRANAEFYGSPSREQPFNRQFGRG